MPVDYLQIQNQIKDYGDKAFTRERELGEKRRLGLETLIAHARDLEALQARVERALGFNSSLRCARPTTEALDARFPLPPGPPEVTLLAADGSQINPDRHAAVDFCVINVGALQMRMGSSAPPQASVRSRLLDVDELYVDEGLISEGTVALKRDLAERRYLVDLVQDAPPPVITLTDGQLELFREPRPTPEFDRAFEDYLKVLAELSETGAATAGYVDRPRSDLVARLLELALLPEDQLERAGKERKLGRLADTSLFQELLPTPGDRSAVFAIQSPSAQKFTARLSLHFFYLNVGRPGKPSLVRVEIPEWVASNAEMLKDLQAVLVAQCRILGARPYPYALHRAHEVAKVAFEEKERLEEILSSELQRRGLGLGQKSNKQFHKESSGRTRYAP